jgi:hypothetical protein
MITYQRKAGTADISVVVRVIDSTDGTPETGFAYDTAGIDMWYRREGGLRVAITEVTLAALDSAHADGGIKHISDGYVRVDLPDAACVAGAAGVLIGGVATGMVVIGCYVQLVACDPFDSVRLGLTALPNAAADAAGGLPISDAGALDLDARLDAAISSRSTLTAQQVWEYATRVLTAGTNIALAKGVGVTGFTDLDAAGVRSAVGLATANLDTQLGDLPTNAELSAAVANVSVDEIQATALADLFNTNSGTTYASAVAGSPVKEIADNAGGSALTEAGIADAVWDEALAGHLGAGSTGAALDDAGAAGDPWSTPIPGAYGAGTAGKILGDNINAPIATVDTVVDAILTESQSHPTLAEIEASATLAKQAKLDTLHDTRIPGVIQPQTGDSFARVGAAGAGLTAVPWNAAWDAEVQSEAQDAITASALATAAALATVDDFLDTEVAAILAAVDTEIAAIKAKTDNLPEGIAKNTALANFTFFMADSTDHVSGKTGLTVTATRSLDGAAFAACANAPVEIANGIYKIALAATDLNGDVITLRFTAAAADDTVIHIKTEVA